MKWVIIGIVLIIAVAVGVYWYDEHGAEAALLKQPIYQVLKKHEPDVYEKVLSEYELYKRDETPRESFINTANSEISLAATRHLGQASTPAVLALMHDMLDTARTLQKQPGDSCFRYWFPQVSGPPDIARYIGTAPQAHTLDLMAEVIRSAAEDPVAMPSADKVKGNLAAIINDTYAEFGADAQLIAHASEPNVDRARICTITNSVYERILKLPPADSSALLRAMTQVR